MRRTCAPRPHLLEVAVCGVAVRETGARDAAVCDRVNVRAVAEQGVLALAVALRELFPAAWTAQEVLARTEAVQEVLVRTVPLQEVLTRVLVVRKVLARAVAGWWVGGAPSA